LMPVFGFADVLAVGVGGFLGAVCRWLLSSIVQDGFRLPMGTLAVNVLGCFALGFFAELASTYGLLTRSERLFLMAGFAGSFTTFSTFIYESVMMGNENVVMGLTNIVVSITLGILGLMLGKTVAVVVMGRG